MLYQLTQISYLILQLVQCPVRLILKLQLQNQLPVKTTLQVTNTVTGTGIEHDGGSMSPDATSVSGTVGGHSYTWTGANMETKPKWSLTNPSSGNAFQFTETYSGPGLQNVTSINRVIETESVVISTSVFQ